MEEDCGISDQSIGVTGSGTKVMVGEKRGRVQVEERSELCHKRVKMRDLESVLRREERTEMGTDPALRLLDLNANIAAPGNATASHVEETDKLPSLGNKDNGPEGDSMKSKGFALDLNAEDVSSSINHEPLYPCKNSSLKSKDDFECASSVGPLDENESMRLWNEMKQNGFLSHTHGVAPMPKLQGRKSKNDGMKKKMELAKKERVSRFAKIAAPSGLLNGLNPGIINHVRNRFIGGDGGSCMVDTRVTGKTVYHPNHNIDTEDDALVLKLSSTTTIASDNTSSLSNEESANLASVTSLSVKAANVASQWLELLHQDIKGRLAALRRSKKRVRAVIHTEFPSLLSKEFSSNQENSSYGSQNSSVGHFDNSIAHAHRARWTALFDQMDRALSEEEKQLESSLNQVRQMQMQCEHGLQKYGAPYSLHQMGILQNDCRLEKAESPERDLAVRAAAASIYSTCNFLSSMENLPCC
ncbi:uncharacterized protein LOC107769149 isoform X2 [Nicotiana tabacum]|uniref:Uncharacterized protein LOC107769149 isoform X2 n=1 Tax=Nicotiana tabacum TaxID=4097 RepID=A0AC58UFH1_TOBAC|nr:uncharacterized protein LOC104114753 isoform X2 [Nicotiana tomentosiformis]